MIHSIECGILFLSATVDWCQRVNGATQRRVCSPGTSGLHEQGRPIICCDDVAVLSVMRALLFPAKSHDQFVCSRDKQCSRDGKSVSGVDGDCTANIMTLSLNERHWISHCLKQTMT